MDFQLAFEPNVPDIRGSEAQLTEIFMNLVENACRAVHQTPQPVVKVEGKFDPTESAIHIRVTDNGTGIDPQVRDRLFFKPVPSGAQHGVSSGLGLWLSKLILDSMGGDIVVEKTNPQRGTTLRVTLPVLPVLEA
jgi:signal transduction histidine kinase